MMTDKFLLLIQTRMRMKLKEEIGEYMTMMNIYLMWRTSKKELNMLVSHFIKIQGYNFSG